jgi:hypothetical protein
MKWTAFIVFLHVAIFCNAQEKIFILDKLYEGKIIDSTVTSQLILYPNYIPYYYSFNVKYPLSSQTMVKNANDFLKTKGHFNENGYLTFKFMIDNEGQMNFVKYSQINQNYEPRVFDNDFVKNLCSFLKTLKNWEKAQYEYEKNKTPISYVSYISFKIEDGKVINIIP